LTRANLSRAILRGAILTKASLSAANLRGAEVTREQLITCTSLPDGTTVPDDQDFPPGWK